MSVLEREARRDETERCALLCEMRGAISRQSAARIRKEGTYTIRAIWPPFKKLERVAPKWERNASLLDDVAQAFDVVAKCIRLGYDPRLLHDPAEKIDMGSAKAGVHFPGRDPTASEII